MSRPIPRQMDDLGYIRQIAEQVKGSKPENSTPPWPLLLVSASKFLPWLPSVMDHNLQAEMNPSLPKLLWVRVLYHSGREQRRTFHLWASYLTSLVLIVFIHKGGGIAFHTS